MSKKKQVQKTVVLYSKTSKSIKDAWDKIKDKKKILYSMDFFEGDEEYTGQIGEMECDVLFIGEDNFIIRQTEDGRFYCRTSNNDPVGGPPNQDNLPELKYPWCTHGSYFNSIEEAIETTITWLLLEPEDLPRCYDPPIAPSETSYL